MRRRQSKVALILLAALVTSTLAQRVHADWDPKNPADVAKAKWVQLPDLNPTGLDVLDTVQPVFTVPPGPGWKTLADDFLCNQTGPIIDAHIWGSWLSDVLPVNSAGVSDPNLIQFKISFWDDVPKSAANSFSHPGNQLWTGIFNPGQFTVNPNVLNAQEGFFDPNLGQLIGTDTHVYQYNFPNLIDALGNRFVQTSGNIYWFEVQANVLNLPGTTATFGWKTSRIQDRFNDDAVFADTGIFNGPNATPWRDLHYPAGGAFAGQSMDLSFVLTVPEPSSLAMCGLGLVALVGTVIRRKRGNS